MPSGVGIGTGIGEGLKSIGESLSRKWEIQHYDRERQADTYEEQARKISENIAKVGGKDHPDAAPYILQLQDVISKHNALYPPHETPKLVARIQKFLGKTPKPAQADYRTSPTAESYMAAAPAHPQVWQTDKEAPLPFKPSGGIVYRAEVNSATGQKRWQPAAGVSPRDIEPQAMQDMRAAGMSEEEIQDAARIKAGLEPKATARKPLTFAYHPQTGGLTSITDPNSGVTYDASNLGNAPPEIKTRFEAIQNQQQAEIKRKEEVEAKRNQEAEDRQNRFIAASLDRQAKALQNSLDAKDYASAKKVVTDIDNEYQSAIDRQRTMDQNLAAALKGDQQAMLSLVNNHIQMTVGKNQRITQTLFNEAASSTPWLQKIAAKFDDRGYLSGVTLAPEQMQSMVNLAHEKVDVLKDHVQRARDQYQNELGLNQPNRQNQPNPGATQAPATPAPADDDPLGILPPKKPK